MEWVTFVIGLTSVGHLNDVLILGVARRGLDEHQWPLQWHALTPCMSDRDHAVDRPHSHLLIVRPIVVIAFPDADDLLSSMGALL
jgi:hypothetical protein